MHVLRNAGFCWVAMPDNFIAPLQLLRKGKDGVDQLNTSIAKIFKPNTYALPAISGDIEYTSAIADDEEIDFKAKADVSILQSLAKVFSKNTSIGFNYDNTSSGKLNLIKPMRNFIDIADLDSFIGDATLVEAAKSTIKDLKNDDLYVITEIVKAKGFSLETNEENKKDASLNAGTVVADADVSFGKNSEAKIIMKEDGDVYKTVAVKAYRIYYDKPGFFSDGPASFRIKQEDLTNVRDDEDYNGTLLNEDLITL